MPIDRLAQPDDVLRALPAAMAGSFRQPVAEVVRRLRAAGLRLPPGSDAEELVLDAVDSGRSLWTLGPDLEVVDVARVMSGRVLTVRLTATEGAEGRLRVDRDFPGYAFEHLAASGLTLADGQVRDLFGDPDWSMMAPLAFRLPEGAFDGLGLGVDDLAGVAYEGGVAKLVAVGEVGDPGPLIRDLAAALVGAGIVEIDEPFERLLTTTEHFRRPLAPVSEILTEAGFGQDGDYIAATPEQLAEDHLAHEMHRVARDYELSPDEAAAVVGAVWHARALQTVLEGPGAPGDTPGGATHGAADDATPGAGDESPGDESPDDIGGDDIPQWALERLAAVQSAVAAAPVRLLEVRHGLADPWLAFAVGDEALSLEDAHLDGLELLCQTLAQSETAPATRGERAGLEYLMGRCREHAGDPLSAERHFQQAVSLDPDHSYAMLGLAAIAADRGQYETAQSLLDRAGADEHHPLRSAVHLARQDSSAPQRLPGRNEPCWCGSGRKFKVCHARVSTSPLPARARGLLGRALAWLSATGPGSIRELLEYAMAISGGRASIDDLVALVPDVVLIEGGALADYLDRRADLIADDEAMLAQQWLLRPRSLFEVEIVRPGEGMTLRDVMTGDRVDVRERSASTQLTVGDLLLTRVANVGDHEEIFGGGTALRFGERDQVIELLSDDPSPLDLVRFVAGRHLPPDVVTPEGDPLESVEGTFTTTAPAQLRRALDGLLDPAGDGTWNLLEEMSGGRARVLGTVELEGRTLRVSAMSVPRYERLLEMLDSLDVRLVEKSREVGGLDDAPPGGGAGTGAGAGIGVVGAAATTYARASGPGLGSATGAASAGGASHGLLRHRGIEPGPGSSGSVPKGRGAAAGPSASGPFLGPDEIARDPELLAHMASYIADYERAWCDEPVPALGGVTPRQAAADPTRRGDLIALLNSFPSSGSPLEMDGGRLKGALGLEG